MVRNFFRALVLLILIAAIWLGFVLAVPKRPAATGTVLLRPGWSSRRIANELKSAGVIRSANAFLLLHAVRLKRLKAGEYLFDQPASALAVYERLARGDIYFHTVVVPEGFNMFDIAGAMEAAGLCTRAEFLQEAKTDLVPVHDLDPDAQSLEGYLFPDTYRFTRAQSIHDFASAMVRRFRQEATAIGLIAAPGAAEDNSAVRLPIHRIVTMASIVEKETAVAEERATVAGVYYNRLQKNMALQADPSVIYAALIAGRYTGAIHQSDLEFLSPYNTYRSPGLPPGPIANPGRASLVAAMHPQANDFLYFVADGHGGHRFARTLDEHNQNVAAYRRAVASQNR